MFLSLTSKIHLKIFFIDVLFSILVLDSFFKNAKRFILMWTCKLFFLPNQDFTVIWFRVENGTFSVLAYFLSSLQNTTTINEPQLSWKKELINQSDFFFTLRDLSLLDSGEYLCTISSSKYTLLIFQTLHVGKLQIELIISFDYSSRDCEYQTRKSDWHLKNTLD